MNLSIWQTVHIDYNQFHNLSVNIVISLTFFTGSHVSCSILIIFWMDTHFVALISYKPLSACQGTYFVNLKHTHAKQRGYWWHNGWPALLWTWKLAMCSQMVSWSHTSHSSRFNHFLNVLRVALARWNKNQIFPTQVLFTHLHQLGTNSVLLFNSSFFWKSKHSISIGNVLLPPFFSKHLPSYQPVEIILIK